MASLTLKGKSEARAFSLNRIKSILAESPKKGLDIQVSESLNGLLDELNPGQINSGFIACYQALSHEPEVVLSLSKNLCFPKVNSNQGLDYYVAQNSTPTWLKSSWGVLEPDISSTDWKLVSPEKMAMVLIPALGFTDQGFRLGHGKGCYDRFLPDLPENTLKVGVGYSVSVTPQDWVEEDHDIKLDFIVTDKFVIKVF